MSRLRAFLQEIKLSKLSFGPEKNLHPAAGEYLKLQLCCKICRMRDHYLAFNKEWFGKHQERLLRFLNCPVLSPAFRILLLIHGDRRSIKGRIDEIAPNFIRSGRTYEFRTHWKFSRRIYFGLRPIWWLLHFWDWVFADRFAPQLSFNFTTL